VKVTITNFNYRMNYSEWNMVVQHPNFDNLTQLFSFNYKSLTPYGSISKCDPNLFRFLELKTFLNTVNIFLILHHKTSKLLLLILINYRR